MILYRWKGWLLAGPLVWKARFKSVWKVVKEGLEAPYKSSSDDDWRGSSL